MLPFISGDVIDLTCNELMLPEFPELLFGTAIETNTVYFDATAYLKSKNIPTQISDFILQYGAQIQALQQSYEIPNSEICKLNREGHSLIHGNFAYLFLSFADSNFLAYVFDRIHELFNEGFCISDTYLYNAASQRLPDSMFKFSKNESDK